MRYSAVAPAFLALLAIAAPATAQQAAVPAKLEVGEWTGQVTPPEGITVDVLYDVAYAGDTLKITIRAAEHGTFAARDVTLETDKLSFKFSPGPEVSCVLHKKDTGYSGVCTEADGSTATMSLSPPRKEKKSW